MNPNTAIILSEAYLRNPLCNLKPSEREASQLGIEALKRIKLQHDPAGVITPDLLPGETEGE